MDNSSMTWLPELEMEGLGNILRHHQLNPCYRESVDLFSSESFKGSPDVVTTSSIHVATINGDVDKQQDTKTTNIINPFVPSQVPPPNAFTLSFGNPMSPQEINHINGRSKQNYSDVVMSEDDAGLNELLGSIDGTTRSRITRRRNHRQVQEHVLAERKRREKLAERFISLSTLLPGLKKMDKGTVLEDARNYIIQLQTRVKELEQTSVKGKDTLQESKFFGGHEDVACSSNDTNYLPSSPEIKARISGSNILVRIYYMKSSSIILKTLTEMEKLHVSIVCYSVLPFGNAHLITIIAQMSDEMAITAKYLVKSLLSTLRDFN